jgi:hypothetical protein
MTIGNSVRGLVSVALLVTSAVAMVRPAAAAETPAHCPAVEPAGVPRATITNGLVSAVVLLPDAEKGYYRGARFDWSGVVWCLVYKGHNYFGVWNPRSDPLSGNAITGPVNEFFGGDGRTGIGYDQARPGELFLKPGVGVLRRIGPEPYSINGRYPIVDGGKWTVRTAKRGVTYRQALKSPLGIEYAYQKKLTLDPKLPVLVLEYQMKNTGKMPLDIQVYDHDFFVLDDTRTGPDVALTLPFAPTLDRPLQNGARLDGNRIVYERELADGETAASNITTGFSGAASDFHFTVENTRTGVGVEETGDRPVTRIVFWSNPKTVAPEAYVHLTIAPGQTGRWSIRYRFFARDGV